jgi:hypothetical protein
MERENTEDITFKLLANPTKLKKKTLVDEYDEDDDLLLKLKKRYPGMLFFKSDKEEIIIKIETLLTEITIANIIDNLIAEIEYEHLL